MKNLVVTILILAICVPIASAQLTKKGVSMVSERTKEMSLGNNNALVLDIPQADAKLVGKLWENYIKSYYSGKAEWQRKTKEWFTDNINIPAVGGATPIDLHAKVEEAGSNATFLLWINMGTTFLNSKDNPEEYQEAEKMVSIFAAEVEKEKVRMEIDKQEKELKALEKELEKLVAANDRYHKEIEKAKEAIKRAEDGIVQNVKDQELAKQKIENQKQVLEGTKKKLDDMK